MNFEKFKPTTICHNCSGLSKILDIKNGNFVQGNSKNCIDGFIKESVIEMSRKGIINFSDDTDLFYSDNISSDDNSSDSTSSSSSE